MDLKTYLENEKRSDSKSEYLAGQLRPMLAGDDDVHFALRLNFAFLLKEHLSRHRPDYRIYVGDTRVYVESADAMLYPDILISGAESDAQQSDYKSKPLVVVEIVTAESGGYDRGRKFRLYRQIPELQEYILVETETAAVECLHREGERWVLESYTERDTITVPCLDFKGELEAIYQDIFSDADSD